MIILFLNYKYKDREQWDTIGEIKNMNIPFTLLVIVDEAKFVCQDHATTYFYLLLPTSFYEIAALLCCGLKVSQCNQPHKI